MKNLLKMEFTPIWNILESYYWKMIMNVHLGKKKKNLIKILTVAS